MKVDLETGLPLFNNIIMEEIINKLLERVQSLNSRYLNEEITACEKTSGIETQQKIAFIAIRDLERVQREAIFSAIDDSNLNKVERELLKKVVYASSIV